MPSVISEESASFLSYEQAVTLQTCALTEQLHALSWWKALTCVSASSATIPVVFHFSRGVQLPSYILFLQVASETVEG